MSEERVPTAAELAVLVQIGAYIMPAYLLPEAELKSCTAAGWVEAGETNGYPWTHLSNTGKAMAARTQAGTATLAHLRSLLAEMERGEAARREFAQLVIQGAELLDRAGDVALVSDAYLSEDGDNYISLNAYNLPAHIRSIYERSGGRGGEIVVIIMPAPKDGGRS